MALFLNIQLGAHVRLHLISYLTKRFSSSLKLHVSSPSKCLTIALDRTSLGIILAFIAILSEVLF